MEFLLPQEQATRTFVVHRPERTEYYGGCEQHAEDVPVELTGPASRMALARILAVKTPPLNPLDEAEAKVRARWHPSLHRLAGGFSKRSPCR